MTVDPRTHADIDRDMFLAALARVGDTAKRMAALGQTGPDLPNSDRSPFVALGALLLDGALPACVQASVVEQLARRLDVAAFEILQNGRVISQFDVRAMQALELVAGGAA